MIETLPDMLLACEGSASYTTASLATTNLYGSNGASVSGSSLLAGRASGGATAAFEASQGVARLRPPKVIVPALSVGGKQGWWEVVNLSADPQQISGQIKFGLIARGKFDIDRRTGVMRISALGESFEGVCTKAPTEAKF